MVEPDVIAADPELHEMFVGGDRGERRRVQRPASTGSKQRSPTPTRDAAPQAGPPGRAGGAAERDRDPHRRDRQLPGLAAFHRDARATEHADVEIRALAVACLRQLQTLAPNVFDDFAISTLADGTEIAASPFVAEG